MTGAELAALRRAKGLSQAALGRLAGIGRHAVSYWETRPRVDRRAWAVLRIGTVLDLPSPSPRTRRAVFAAERRDRIECEVRRQLAAWHLREAQRTARRRVRCGAKTRRGTPCRCLWEPGKRRCRFHGGKSTGAKTAEGRARIAEAQRRRWARWRQGKAGGVGPDGPQPGG